MKYLNMPERTTWHGNPVAVKLICACCGKEFQVSFKKRKQRYCSQRCGYEANKTGSFKTCKTCGSIFWCVPSAENTEDKKGLYCSKKCSGLAIRASGSFSLKEYVQGITRAAIKKGLITKKPCEVCGSLEVEAHHDDYSKPFNVRWFCCGHHRQYHWKLAQLNKLTA